MTAILSGIAVSPGVAAGPVAVMAPAPSVPEASEPIGAKDEEAAAAKAALEAVAGDLEARGATASGAAADVLRAQAMMARDPVLAAKVVERIEAGVAGPRAVSDALAEFRARLEGLGGYMAERAADLDDLRDRVVAHLLGLPMPGLPVRDFPYVLIASDLAPADAATLDPSRVLAIVTEEGSPTSHTAILARALGVPAVVACRGAGALTDGITVLVDGRAGQVTVAPADVLIEAAMKAEDLRRAAAARASGPGRTADGHPVKLLVNLGTAREADAAAAADSEGVGLLRTELLFLDRAEAPSQAEQREVYRSVFDAFAGREVVVRTLDAGADKPLRFATQSAEPNPALGVRGLRTARRLPELLATQLAALADAAGGSRADVWVMAPMVSTAGEAEAFAAQAHEHGLGMAGVMVEVPAAALRACSLAAVCDFFSLGTNDLAQYAMAADRTLGELADLLDPWQPAVLELVRMAAAAGAAANKPVGVCGESASDPLMALVLTGLGVTSLSMAPVSLPGVRAALARHSLETCVQMAGRALCATDAAQARTAVRALVRDRGAGKRGSA